MKLSLAENTCMTKGNVVACHVHLHSRSSRFQLLLEPILDDSEEGREEGQLVLNS